MTPADPVLAALKELQEAADAFKRSNAYRRCFTLEDLTRPTVKARYDLLAARNSTDAERLRLSLAAMDAALGGGWQPIATAPRDGTEIDLWVPGVPIGHGPARIPDCWFSGSRWWRYDKDGDDQCRSHVRRPSHWMPPPPPPAPEEG